MKQLLLIVAALLLTTGLVWADAYTGSTAQSHTVTVNVILPQRVGIDIATGEHTKTLDLTASALYPPLVPTYFQVGTNVIRIMSTGNYDYACAASMTATPGGLTLGELEYQGSGWTPDAGAGWHAFAATQAMQGTAGTPHARTAGWENRNLDYQVSLDGAETNGTHTWQLIYTITPH